MDDRTKTKLVVKAIQNITGGATKFLLVNNEISSLEWKEVDIEKPSEADIKDEYDKLVIEYDAQEYARNRASEYPSIPDQLDEIYHNGIDSWKAVIKVTKDKYPKG